MTLPQLIEIANQYGTNKVQLTQFEKDFLILLLKAYAEDVLNCGQCVQMGQVVMTKTIQGSVLIEIRKARDVADLPNFRSHRDL